MIILHKRCLSGVFQEAHKGTALGVQGLFLTDQAYNFIFIIAALVSVASVAMALYVSRARLQTSAITSKQHQTNRAYG